MQYANKYYSTIVCNVYSSVCTAGLRPSTACCIPSPAGVREPLHSDTVRLLDPALDEVLPVKTFMVFQWQKNTSTVFGPDEETRCTEHTFGKLGIWKIPKQHSVTVFFNGAAKTSWIICLSRTNFSIINRAEIVLIISLSRHVCRTFI